MIEPLSRCPRSSSHPRLPANLAADWQCSRRPAPRPRRLVILIAQPVTRLTDISDQLSYADAVTSQDQVDDGIDEEFLQRRFHASFSVTMRHFAFRPRLGMGGGLPPPRGRMMASPIVLALLVVRTAVEHEWLAADLINLSLDDRHRAPRTAGDGGALSSQPNAEAVAPLGAVDPRPAIVDQDLLNPSAIVARHGSGNGRV